MRIEGLYPMGYTSVPHSFIDQYMTAANGEFVKTYLLLLRLSESGDLSVPELADKLQQTEGDVRRALKYWAAQGLLRVEEKEGEIQQVAVLFPAAEKSREETPKGPRDAAPDKKQPEKNPGARSYSAEELIQLKANPDFDQLLFAVEHYLGRSLSDRDVDMLAYLYEGLGFPGEVLEYLTEYCVERFERENKKKDYHIMRYMEKVALNWHSRGAVTLELAKKQTAMFAQDTATFGAVTKALGLKGRQLTEAECQQVSYWMGDMQMPQELVLEACHRTIRQIHTPDFRYIEGILKNWHKQKIASMKQLLEAEGSGQEGAARKKSQPEKGHYQNTLEEVDYAKLLTKKG